MSIRFSRWILAGTALCALARPAAACEGTRYGGGVSIAEATPIATLVADPEAWVGKSVRVEGQVKEVCEMAGCWMEIAAAAPVGSSAEAQTIRFKVKDGEMVFPVAARGKSAEAQGTFERLELSRSKFVSYRKHQAKEQGLEFDEASVVGDGPFRVYQIAGSGATICN